MTYGSLFQGLKGRRNGLIPCQMLEEDVRKRRAERELRRQKSERVSRGEERELEQTINDSLDHDRKRKTHANLLGLYGIELAVREEGSLVVFRTIRRLQRSLISKVQLHR